MGVKFSEIQVHVKLRSNGEETMVGNITPCNSSIPQHVEFANVWHTSWLDIIHYRPNGRNATDSIEGIQMLRQPHLTHSHIRGFSGDRIQKRI